MSIPSRKKHDIIKLKGTAKYCHLNEPNKKFNAEFGVWSCDLVVSSEQAEVLKQAIRPLYEEELQKVQDANPGKEIKQAQKPFDEQSDGTSLVRIKRKGGGRRADGTTYTLSSPALYDSAGKPLPEDVQIWGGSKMNVAFRPNFWYIPALGFGVSLDLEAVQVIELANGGVSNVAAEAFGFTEEEGFVANGGETLDAVFSAEDNQEEQATVTTADF
jgi:hypothetical protein